MRVNSIRINYSNPYMVAMALSRVLGGPRAEKLLAHFNQTTARFSCREYDHSFSIKRRHPGQKQSPIILGNIDDLSFYEVNAAKRKLNYLNAYLLMPLRGGKMAFICDDHSHAAFAWALMQSCGVLKGNAALIHIDEHSDTKRISGFERSERPFLYDTARQVWEKLDINQFIDFAAGNKGPNGPLVDIKEIYFIDPTLNGKLVNRAAPPGMPDYIPFNDLSIDLAGTMIEQLKSAGRSIICDIDLDFFCGHYRDSWQGNSFGLDFKAALQQVIQAARQADFISIATSPDFFTVLEQRNETRGLLQRIINGLKA